MKKTLISSLFIFLSLISRSQTQIITTIAGNGTMGFIGDGGPALLAEMHFPVSVAVDGAGNVYFSDWSNARIRKIDLYGNISTFAGNGSPGFFGDGGPATAAEINLPEGITFDRFGNLYLSDQGNGRIRKISPAGIITTVAGHGSSLYSGDGGPATDAGMFPNDVAVDFIGNLYIADLNNQRIRKVDTSGIITTIAGTGTPAYTGDGGMATGATLHDPCNVYLDSSGNVFISDFYNQVIRKIDGSGTIHTIAGNGFGSGGFSGGYSGDGAAATAAELSAPHAVAVDAAGNLFISDWLNNRVRKVNTVGTITTAVGTGAPAFGGDGGPATAAQISSSPYLTIDKATGNMYIADDDNERIRMVVNANQNPSFIHGHHLHRLICENGLDTGFSPLLAVIDTTIGLTINWSLLSGPLHGTAVVTYSSLSTGGIVIPAGMSYTPVAGYSGMDSFSVVVTDGLGSDTLTVIENVSSGPEIGAITGGPAVCNDSAIALADTTAGGSWSITNTAIATIAGGIVTALAPGSDTVFYAVTGGCGTSMISAVIHVDTFPHAGTITGLTSLCPHDSLLLSDIAPGGVWSSSNGTIATVSGAGHMWGASDGADTIKYTVTNACGTAVARFAITVGGLCPGGVKTVPSASYDRLTVFPNPNDGMFTANIASAYDEGAHIVIANMLGETITQLDVRTNQPQTITLSQQPPGIYFISAYTTTGRFVAKVLVE